MDIFIQNQILSSVHLTTEEKSNLGIYDESFSIPIEDLNDLLFMKFFIKVLSTVSITEKGEIILFKYNNKLWLTGHHDYSAQSRGKVIDAATRDIIVYGFDKFYNINEVPETSFENVSKKIKAADYITLEDKRDGSTIFVTKTKNHGLIVNSNGDFKNDQITKANQLLDSSYKFFKEHLKTAYTYIFEITYPLDKKVVDYGDEEKLVLIGIRDTETGRMLKRFECMEEAKRLNLEIVESYEFKTLDELLYKAQTLTNANKEGWVLKLYKEDEIFIVKIKLKEYIEKHMVISEKYSFYKIHNFIHRGIIDDFVSQLSNQSAIDSVNETIQQVYQVFDYLILKGEEKIKEIEEKTGFTRSYILEIKDGLHPEKKQEYTDFVKSLFKERDYFNSKILSSYLLSGISPSDTVQAMKLKDFKQICLKYHWANEMEFLGIE